jgi:hypothetical protein
VYQVIDRHALRFGQPVIGRRLDGKLLLEELLHDNLNTHRVRV